MNVGSILVDKYLVIIGENPICIFVLSKDFLQKAVWIDKIGSYFLQMLYSITIFEPAIDKECKENPQGYELTDVDEILQQQ